MHTPEGELGGRKSPEFQLLTPPRALAPVLVLALVRRVDLRAVGRLCQSFCILRECVRLRVRRRRRHPRSRLFNRARLPTVLTNIAHRFRAPSSPSARRALPGGVAFDAAGECRARDGHLRQSRAPGAARAPHAAHRPRSRRTRGRASMSSLSVESILRAVVHSQEKHASRCPDARGHPYFKCRATLFV